MTPDEFSSVLHQVFVEYDKNENGLLDPQEFEEAITSSGIQFSPKEKMMMLLAADENEDGDISYGEFAAVALQVLLVVFLPSQRQRQTHSLTGGVSEGRRKEEGADGLHVCAVYNPYSPALAKPASSRSGCIPLAVCRSVGSRGARLDRGGVCLQGVPVRVLLTRLCWMGADDGVGQERAARESYQRGNGR